MRFKGRIIGALVWLVLMAMVAPLWAWFPEGVEAEWVFGARSMTPLSHTDEADDDGMISNEVRLEGTLLAGRGGFTLYATPELRVNDAFSSDMPGGEVRFRDSGTTLGRNLTLSSTWYELSFRELYVEKEMWESRWRAGNQVFSWGTADFINPTSYFNPEDLRELFLKEEDALTVGVPAVSMLRFMGDYSIEAVVMPLGIPRLGTWEGDYFYIAPDNFSLPLRITESQAPAATIEHVGVGARAARSVGSCDLSVSLYHGPDRDPLFRPHRVSAVPGEAVTTVIEPIHGVITAVGADISVDLGQCVAQVEGAWTFDKEGYVDQDVTDPASMIFPYPVVASDFWSVSAGLNWFVPVADWFPSHDGETVVTVEGHRSGYTRGGLGDPLYDETLALRYQDSFRESRVPVSLSWVMDGEGEGEMTWAKAGYDFQNGVVVEGSVVFFEGDEPTRNEVGSPFWYLKDRDLFMLTVTWAF